MELAPPNTPEQAALIEESLGEEEHDYLLALGRFIDSFAKVELSLQLTLWRYTNVVESVGKAVFSGARSDVARGYLRRLADVKAIPEEEWSGLRLILDQLRHITERRNDILHYGVYDMGEGIKLSSNAIIAHTDASVRMHLVSKEILNQMRLDLTTIVVLLAARYAKDPRMKISPESLDAIERSPWRYKPTPLEQSRAPQDDTNQAPPRQPQPSPA